MGPADTGYPSKHGAIQRTRYPNPKYEVRMYNQILHRGHRRRQMILRPWTPNAGSRPRESYGQTDESIYCIRYGNVPWDSKAADLLYQCHQGGMMEIVRRQASRPIIPTPYANTC